MRDDTTMSLALAAGGFREARGGVLGLVDYFSSGLVVCGPSENGQRTEGGNSDNARDTSTGSGGQARLPAMRR